MNREDLPRLTDEERAELDSGYVAIEGVPVGDEPAHTKAPWTLTLDPAFPAELAIDASVDGKTVHIALVHGVGTDEETQANAALIVASPDLLHAAKVLLAAFGGATPDWLRAEAAALEVAVAAAEGRL